MEVELILRNQVWSSKTNFMQWIDENTTTGACEVCGKPILLVPWGRKRYTCSAECSLIRRERDGVKHHERCPTCGTFMTADRRKFRERARRYPLPDWYREAEEEVKAKAKEAKAT